MKTTIDLPPELIRAMKLRALQENQKLKDVAAELIKRGLANPEPAEKRPSIKPKIKITSNGLPVVHCSPSAPVKRMSTNDLLALEQEAITQEDLKRLGHAL